MGSLKLQPDGTFAYNSVIEEGSRAGSLSCLQLLALTKINAVLKRKGLVACDVTYNFQERLFGHDIDVEAYGCTKCVECVKCVKS